MKSGLKRQTLDVLTIHDMIMTHRQLMTEIDQMSLSGPYFISHLIG